MFKVLIMDESASAQVLGRLASRKMREECPGFSMEFMYSRMEAEVVLKGNPFAYDLVIIDLGEGREQQLYAIGLAGELWKRNHQLHLVFIASGPVPREIYSVPHIFVLNKPWTSKDVGYGVKVIKARIEDGKLCCGGRIPVAQGSDLYMVPEREILYARKSRRGLELVCLGAGFSVRETMDEFVARTHGRFCRCHNSYSFNICHLISFSDDQIVLATGDNLPVSRSYKGSVKEYLKSLTSR